MMALLGNLFVLIAVILLGIKMNPVTIFGFLGGFLVELVAKYSTKDKRLTRGKIYTGMFIQTRLPLHGGLRFVCFDNFNKWMTFDPRAFKPLN